LGGQNVTGDRGHAFVPLGQVADIRIVGGPPMVRDEGGLLVGYVFVDVDPAHGDLGGYVSEAKRVVSAAVRDHALQIPQGHFLKWAGQYEELEKMTDRMRIVIPATLLIVVLLLFLHFRNFTEVLIVLLSVPFALAGSVWLLWLLDYRLSTPVWVGLIALVGLAAQTGIVMILYIDNAYLRRKREGRIRDLDDIMRAHMEGTVQRVRPKLMTVATMLAGLVPLLWATGSGAEVMKRMAAPMVGGLVTSALLTLEIIRSSIRTGDRNSSSGSGSRISTPGSWPCSGSGPGCKAPAGRCLRQPESRPSIWSCPRLCSRPRSPSPSSSSCSLERVIPGIARRRGASSGPPGKPRR